MSGSIKSNASTVKGPVVSPVTGDASLRFDTPTEYITSGNQSSYLLSGVCATENKISVYVNDVLFSDQVSCSSGLFTISVDVSSSPSGDLVIKAITELANASQVESSVTILKDTVAPSFGGSINDGTTSTSLTQTPSLSWSAATDAHSGVSHYELAIGTSAGGTQVLAWTNISNVLTYQRSGLSLSNGQTYYASVRAVDAAGNTSTALNGDGWAVSTGGGGGSGVTGTGLNYSKMSNDGFSPLARGASFDLQFAQSVAISEDGLTMAIGHPYDMTDENGNLNSISNRSGSVYLYEYSGGAWVFSQKIVLSNTQANPLKGDQFGVHVALSGSTLAVGASNHYLDENNLNADDYWASGAIFIYVKSGSTWGLQQKIVDPQRATYKFFGEIFDLDDNTLVVGVPRANLDENNLNNLSQAGAAFVFFRTGTTWSLEGHLMPSGTNSRNSSDTFGSSIAVDADTVIVGSPNHDYDATGASNLSNAGAAFIYKRATGVWSLEEKIVASGTNARRSSDNFGTSVDVYADVSVVGATGQDFNETGASSVSNAGAVYVFNRAVNDWSLTTKLVGTGSANARIANDQFGYKVKLDASTLVVAALYQDYDSSGANVQANAGALYVFVNSGTWGIEQKITATGTNSRVGDSAGSYADQFSKSIAIAGDKIISGAPGQDYDASGSNKIFNAGAAFSFERSTGTWTQTQKVVDTIVPSSRSSLYNSIYYNYKQVVEVSSDGQILIIGSAGESYDQNNLNPEYRAGVVYVYKKVSGAWQFSTLITPTGTNSRNQEDYFGASVSLNGNYLAVGAPGHDYDSTGANYSEFSGAVYIYEFDGTNWNQIQKITPTGTNSRHGEGFGTSVKFDGSLLAVGAPSDNYNSSGASYVQLSGAVFMYTQSGSTWSLDEKIVASGVNARLMDNFFGEQIDLNNGTLVVGVPDHHYDESGDNYSDYAGAVFVFTDVAGTWTLQQKIVGVGVNGRVDYDGFGQKIAISGDTIVVGSSNYYLESGVDADSSSMFIFDRSGSVWSLNKRINGETMLHYSSYDGFGSGAVSISGNYIAVSAVANTSDESGANSLTGAGAVYVLKKTAGVWAYETKIVASGTNSRVAEDGFGANVKIVEHSASSYSVGINSNNIYDSSGANPVLGSASTFVFDK